MVTAARCGPEHARIEYAADRDPGAQVGVLLAAVVGMAAQLPDLQTETGVPLDRTAEPQGRRLDLRVPVAGVQDQRLHVLPQPDRPVTCASM